MAKARLLGTKKKSKFNFAMFDASKNRNDTKTLMSHSISSVFPVIVVVFSDILAIMRIRPGVSGTNVNRQEHWQTC